MSKIINPMLLLHNVWYLLNQGSSAGACLEPPHSWVLGMFILDFMLLLKYSSLVLESRVSICCAFHADPNYLYVFFKFYFHAFKVQNCWLLSAVVAKRGMIAVLWMSMVWLYISKILKSSFKDCLIV